MREPRLLGQAVDEGAVCVKLAAPSERTLIESLTQFYVYELTRIEPSRSSPFEVQDCYLPFAGIERYWRVDGFYPVLIRVCGRLAGFALINTHSRSGKKVEFNLADFFIAREYRGVGIGTEAVRLIMAQYPGHWEIAVAKYNMAARMFWSRTLAITPNITHVVRHEGNCLYWHGPIWSFRSVPKQFRSLGLFREARQFGKQVRDLESGWYENGKRF